MLRLHPDRLRLAVVAFVAAMCGVVLLLAGVTPLLSAPAASLLVLVLPGYALMRALFSRRPEIAEQVLMTLAFSVAISIATGLALDLLPSGLTIQQWGGGLAGVCVITCGIAILRGGWTAEPEADRSVAATTDPTAGLTAPAGADSDAMPVTASTAIPRAQLVMIGLAVVILVVALGVARLGVTAQPHEAFTEFWMLPDASGLSVQVGVTNQEGKDTTYRLLLRMDGKTIQTVQGIAVAQGATWEQGLALPIHDTDPHSVTALVYRPDDTLPYREAHSTITLVSVPAGSPGPTAAPGASGPLSSGGPAGSPARTP